MSDQHSQDWDNYWQGRHGTQSGDALVGVGIEHNAVLTAFWNKAFNALPKTARLIDFACGAGSVLKHAHRAKMTNLTGLDISASAIDVLKNKFPMIKGVTSPVDNTPFIDDEFDIITSQFGFEYAGSSKQLEKTIHEMTRILNPNGRIILIAHIKNGVIMRDCQQSLNHIEVMIKNRFIKAAKHTFLTAHKANNEKTQQSKNKAEAAMKQLNKASKPILDWLSQANLEKDNFAKFTHHLLNGSNQLLQNYHKYNPKDGGLWFDGMASETIAYKGRMSSMIKAALSEKDAQKIVSTFRIAGFTPQSLEKLYFTDKHTPAAWIIQTQ